MNVTYDLRGQVALVTGAGSGIGQATASAFAEAGAAVVLADINEQAVRQASGALNAAGHRTAAVTCDVADEGHAAALVQRAISAFGRLDIFFCNDAYLPTIKNERDRCLGARSDTVWAEIPARHRPAHRARAEERRGDLGRGASALSAAVRTRAGPHVSCRVP